MNAVLWFARLWFARVSTCYDELAIARTAETDFRNIYSDFRVNAVLADNYSANLTPNLVQSTLASIDESLARIDARRGDIDESDFFPLRNIHEPLSSVPASLDSLHAQLTTEKRMLKFLRPTVYERQHNAMHAAISTVKNSYFQCLWKIMKTNIDTNTQL